MKIFSKTYAGCTKISSYMLGKLVLILLIVTTLFLQTSGQTLPRKCVNEPEPDANLLKIRTRWALSLGDSKIAVNVYNNPKRLITFLVLHHNEQTGLNLVKDKILKEGGRLIEVVACNGDNPYRYLNFTAAEESYLVDPNRIFTEKFKYPRDDVANELAGEKLPETVVPLVKKFRDGLLRIIFPNSTRSRQFLLRRSEPFLVAVHNNGSDSDTDIDSAGNWKEVNSEKVQKIDEADKDDFFLVTDIPNNSLNLYQHFSGIKQNGLPVFNVAAQKSQKEDILNGDDGSLSIYCGINGIPYINVEAERGHDTEQSVMLDEIIKLVRKRR